MTTKLFCGYCREMMTGYGGTGKSGKVYHYYACKKAKKHLCEKKVVPKEVIEDKVVEACRKLLTDDNIKRIAEAIDTVCRTEYDSSAVKRIKTAISDADAAIENLWQALEKGQGVDMIMARIDKRQSEKAALEAQLAVEAKKERVLSAKQVSHFLMLLKDGDINDAFNRRSLVNIFVNKVYLFDDRFTLVLNSSGHPITIDDIMLDEIEDHFDAQEKCSSLVADAPPKNGILRQKDAVFYLLPLRSSLRNKMKTPLQSETSMVGHNGVFFINPKYEYDIWGCRCRPVIIADNSPLDVS